MDGVIDAEIILRECSGLRKDHKDVWDVHFLLKRVRLVQSFWGGLDYA